MRKKRFLKISRFGGYFRSRFTVYSKFTIKLGLVSLKWVNSFFPSGQNEPLKDRFLDRIVESAKRNIISKKNQKLPFSKEMIAEMIRLGENPSLIQLRNALIPALSFSLLLRNDELRHLSCNHIRSDNKGLIFHIVSSKTDVYRDGKNYSLQTLMETQLSSICFSDT